MEHACCAMAGVVDPDETSAIGRAGAAVATNAARGRAGGPRCMMHAALNAGGLWLGMAPSANEARMRAGCHWSKLTWEFDGRNHNWSRNIG